MQELLGKLNELPESWQLLRFIVDERAKPSPAWLYSSYGATNESDAMVQRFHLGIAMTETDPIREKLGHVPFNAALRLLQSNNLVAMVMREITGSKGGQQVFLAPTTDGLDLLIRAPGNSLNSEQVPLVDPHKVISVFISHSHQDADLVKRLIVLLRSALNLPSSQIRATSVDGFRLPGGANTPEQLRLEVQSAEVLVGIISRASLKSAYVTFELGARWGSGKPMIPLLAPDLGPDSLAGPLQGINALSCRSSSQLHQFVEEMAGHLNVALDRPAAYQKCVDDILKHRPITSASVDDSARQALPLRLSNAAKELLLAAARDENGVVMRFRTASGLHVKINQKDFVTDREPRTETRWYGALSELITSGFVEDRDGKGEVFWLTNLGYDEADIITGETPNTGPQADG